MRVQVYVEADCAFVYAMDCAPSVKKSHQPNLAGAIVFFRVPSVLRPYTYAKARPSVSSIVGILACALEKPKLPASAVLPSQFPSGRLTLRTTHSCTYSNGLSPGLAALAASPGFLITAPAVSGSHNG